MKQPLVSICVPTHDRAEALERGFNSILNQDYSSVEILISDNCSTDGTETLCRQVAASDHRVRYFRHPRNIGLYGNHNFCIDQARGEFLCFFHDHDERDPGFISEYIFFLNQHPEVGVACSDWELVDDSGRRIGTREYSVAPVTPGLTFIEQTLKSGRSSVGAPGAMIRRSALGEIRFDESGPIGFGDFPVWFRIAERSPVGHIPYRLWRWRQSRHSQSARTIESMAQDYYQNLTSYCDHHRARFPDGTERVERWKRHIRQYLFWALAFELGLYYRKTKPGISDPPHPRTVFEILDYQLDPEAFQRVLEKLYSFRTGAVQEAAFFVIQSLVRVRMTAPLAWATYHHLRFRMLLGLG